MQKQGTKSSTSDQMASQNTNIPKGTRDFAPAEMVRRNFIFDTVRSVFRKYGYLPIETPAMENLTTLLGKYGDEGDRLLFKILNSGDFLSKVEYNELQNANYSTLATKICEKGLRYDLTVPFARFVVQHRNDITFPFKRYQIQPVWRADKPQKGRYREFFQCDVDVIGSNSLLNETELVQIIVDVFNILGVEIVLKINNRKILSGIAEIIGQPEKFTDITVAIDKLEKTGIREVNEELALKGIPEKAINELQPILNLSGSTQEKITKLKSILKDSETDMKGVDEIEYIFSIIDDLSLNSDIIFDLTLARGLDYYTGAIFEVVSKNIKIGSICGGGRYDDLTGVFGLPDVSGVGISFGADRIYDVMDQLNLFPDDQVSTTKIMFVNFGETESRYCIPLLTQIRNAGINAEIYPDAVKIKKQMTYANNKGIEYVVLVGENEMQENILTVKNMKTGDQKKIKINDLLIELK